MEKNNVINAGEDKKEGVIVIIVRMKMHRKTSYVDLEKERKSKR